jgi:hypothetical protein
VKILPGDHSGSAWNHNIRDALEKIVDRVIISEKSPVIYIITVKMILHPETGVTCSRNSLPSPPGRPSAELLDHILSERAGVPSSYISRYGTTIYRIM